MREYDVEVCSEECGRTVLAGHDTHWIIWEFAGEVMISKGRAGYCPACGTSVGIDEKGPWREAMVPMSALEWLAGQVADICTCCGEDAEPQSWIDAALKAAEEDGDE